MVEIKGTTVWMTRGDTVVLTITITDVNGEPYVPESGDIIRFAMKKNYTDANPILLKTIPIDTMELIIEPEDTKNLPFGEVKGHYKYDIELTKESGFVDTFIPRADIYILEEVN